MKKDISYLVCIYFQVINDKIFAHIFPDFMNFMLFVQIFINFLISLLVYKKIFYIIDTFTSLSILKTNFHFNFKCFAMHKFQKFI